MRDLWLSAGNQRGGLVWCKRGRCLQLFGLAGGEKVAHVGYCLGAAMHGVVSSGRVKVLSVGSQCAFLVVCAGEDGCLSPRQRRLPEACVTLEPMTLLSGQIAVLRIGVVARV